MTHWDRLSAEDRLFLDVEDSLNNMHIAGCFVFESGPLCREGVGVDIERICAYIESRLYRIPRYRQRLETVPYQELERLQEEYGYGLPYAYGPAREGSLLWQRGDSDAAVARMQEGLSLTRTTGVGMHTTFLLATLAEVRLSRGEKIGVICRALGVSEQSYYRWRKEYGGLRVD